LRELKTKQRQKFFRRQEGKVREASPVTERWPPGADLAEQIPAMTEHLSLGYRELNRTLFM
jgi:hypothetical protein